MITIKAIPVILLSVFIGSCAGKKDQPDCSRLKTGRFESRGISGRGELVIERNDSIQVETDSWTGLVARLRINWIGDCEYRLTALDLTINGEKMEMPKSLLIPITTRITKVTKNYYICSSIEDGNSQATLDTLLILK